jgi:hypothetical protein
MTIISNHPRTHFYKKEISNAYTNLLRKDKGPISTRKKNTLSITYTNWVRKVMDVNYEHDRLSNIIKSILIKVFTTVLYFAVIVGYTTISITHIST